jgi:hypothetical protein
MSSISMPALQSAEAVGNFPMYGRPEASVRNRSLQIPLEDTSAPIWTPSLGVPLLLFCAGDSIISTLHGTAEPITRRPHPWDPMMSTGYAY